MTLKYKDFALNKTLHCHQHVYYDQTKDFEFRAGKIMWLCTRLHRHHEVAVIIILCLNVYHPHYVYH